ncbi:unnamed protein product [Clavelina lepadiformis]|uniref:Uncharacterized protein n=1 Tax=Clavelina lepadiformis TaxID=159417 RepID=A0ABP0H4I6_CLALP
MESMYMESIDTNYINIATSNNMLTDDLIKAVLEIEQDQAPSSNFSSAVVVYYQEQFTNNPMKLVTILQRMLTREQEILNLTKKLPQVFSENKIKSEMPTILYDKIMEIENIVFGATSQISQVWDEYTKVCLEINAHQMDQAISPDPINEMNILLDRQNNLITRKAV